MTYLLIMTIGPVQGFIAAARKTRDLMYGSWLLSDLTKAAANTFPKEHLIFPAPSTDLDTKNNKVMLTNRIVVELDDPVPAAEAASKAVREQLDMRWQEAQQRIKGSYDTTIATKQVEDLPEIFWAAAPIPDTDNGYQQARKQAEQALTARKASYDFNPTPWAAEALQASHINGNKSSIDGVREGVIHSDQYPRPNNTNGEEKAKALLQNFGAGPAEQLSGVDLLKRQGAKDVKRHFASTSAVAARPLAERLQSDKAKADWKSYVDFVYSNGIGVPCPTSFPDVHEELLMASRLDDYALNKENIKTAQAKLAALLKDHADGAEPLPYYALFHADGDHMGAVIDYLAVEGSDQHRELSRKLSEFAAGVEKIVHDHKGVLVYAGGDDVLALLPLHKALSCVEELATSFSKALEQFKDVWGNKPTLSGGLVVVHHMEPLSEALEMARKAEKHAKDLPGKNALTVVVDKRGGAARQVRGRLQDIVTQLNRLGTLLADKELSSGFAYELEAMTRVTPKDVWAAEAIRILKRKKRQHGTGEISADTQKMIQTAVKEVGEKGGIDELANHLIIAQIFVDANRLAIQEQST